MNRKINKKTLSAAAMLKTAGLIIAVLIVGYFFATAFYSRAPKNPDYQDYRIVTFGELGDYDYYVPFPNEAVNQAKLDKNNIPDAVKALDNKKVAIEGYMLPVNLDSDGISAEFALNGNYDMCFYGAPTRINDWVIVKMKTDKKVLFSHEPLLVYGTLSVGEDYQDNELISLYRLEADAVDTGSRIIK